MAGAGFGTGGTTTTCVKENNYLGRGVSLDATLDLSETSIKGVSVSNPNFRNSDKLVYTNIQSLETDKLLILVIRLIKQEYHWEQILNILRFKFRLGASSFMKK